MQRNAENSLVKLLCFSSTSLCHFAPLRQKYRRVNATLTEPEPVPVTAIVCVATVNGIHPRAVCPLSRLKPL